MYTGAMDEITYEVPSPDDAEELLLFYSALQNEHPYLHIYPDDALQSVEELANYIRRLNRLNASHIVVAKHQRRVVGCITVEELTLADQHGMGELGVSVLRAYRDRGIGSRLMREALSWAAGCSEISEIVLHVAETNHRAVHIYTGLGFELDDCGAAAYYRASIDSGDAGGMLCMRLEV